jgi:hypothetical protein
MLSDLLNIFHHIVILLCVILLHAILLIIFPIIVILYCYSLLIVMRLTKHFPSYHHSYGCHSTKCYALY